MIVRSCLIRRATQQSSPPIQSLSRLPSRRHFRSSSFRKDEHGIPNHYETLEINTNASPTEIKKQFYALSKSHHPDLHPNDPTAPQRFVKISEAYATLGSPEKRARYDRDILRTSHSSSPNRPSGSYSSASTPFGGRPASGLSRRRTQFRGPPPSFYSSGGWGQQSEKRGEASQQASHTHEAQGRAQSNTGGEAGMGPGGAAQGFEVPHFNHVAHAQTHSNIQRRRESAQRTRDKRVEEAQRERAGTGGSTLFNFTWVSGMLLAIFWMSGKLASERSVQKKMQQEESAADQTG